MPVSAKFLHEFVRSECNWEDVQALVLEGAHVFHPGLEPDAALTVTPAKDVIAAQYRVQDDQLINLRRAISGAVIFYFHGTTGKLISFDQFLALNQGIHDINRRYNVGGYYVLSGFASLDDQRRDYGVALGEHLEPYLAIIEKDEWRHAKEKRA